ncbi:solute carrier family 26 member 10-like isoform X1 [Microplitis mediator]|uniref:solute carrier family 26 member 10-like isoform X1 n=3 Tax=Microplitis mediator TaxID=375433 RepID=UPI002557B202|nr:solute carrier family 26 member 10-like isoform X1 [Microplitis mediator]XP_057334829.1 solute carrier family 26 member 10-like isoform X1 [Microplitis mediator]XP_057334831.1 solute carrier family 26 member 10-like isoform X1 [Microplitis mediator]
METCRLFDNKIKYDGDKCDEMTNNLELIIRRPVYQQEDLDRYYDYTEPDKSIRQSVINKYKNFEINSWLKKSIPIFHWLPNYQWKKDILGDIAAGFTVAVMHIPQGMAYAMLGNVPPVVGIYMAFFPVLVYMIFGTSRHNSMGTFAVICMMTGKVVLTYSNINQQQNQTNNSSLSIDTLQKTDNPQYSPLEVATVVTFGVSIIQLTMYILRLGLISSLLSDALVSGFTTGAAVHVFTSQIKDLLGLELIKRRGILKVVYTYYDVFNSIDNINITATIISGVTILAIIFNNEVLKPRVNKRCGFPIPIEMMAVVIGTVVSIKMNLNNSYNVITVGHIPVGLPVPSVPQISLLPSIIIDCFVITMVSYSISMSMALIFAQKMNYEVDANQELMAQGFGNLVGSFFSCMPFTASLSRSLVQTAVGGKTQLASLISCFLLLFVLLWIGPLLEPLPKCVLASIIVVALKGMFLQAKDLIKFFKLSTSDGIVWIVTFLIVIILDIEYGLLVGAVLCLVKLIILSTKPYTCKLAVVPGTELYLDTNRYHKTVEIPGIQIFHYSGGLNFATKLYFRKQVYEAAKINPVEKFTDRHNKSENKEIISDESKRLRVFIIDFSALINIDSAGVATVRGIIEDFIKIGVSIYLAGSSGPVFETIRKFNTVEKTSNIFMIFPTVNDAVNYARNENINIPSLLPTRTTYQQIYDQDTSISQL